MHERFLLAALHQAWLGRGFCAPNPSVGAVAVRDGNIIAQSFHSGAGTPHAEQLLLQQLPNDVSGVTLYVTLEPCNHWGKTPPCVREMIDYGIKSVIYAYRDPNPIVAANNTPRILIEHGVDVLHYPLSVIDDFYRSYRHWTLTKKPWVTIKMAQTMDGKIAGPQGERIHLSNSLCSEFTHKNRLHSDVILTTARTIDRDDPELNVRLPSLLAEKDVALICGQSMLNHKAKIFNTARHCHLFHDEYASGLSGLQNSTCHAIPATEGLLDLEAVMSVLGQLGYHDVWVEAGGRLFSALHLARLVHRTHLYLAPLVLGPSAVSAYHHSDVFHSPCHVSWQAMGDNMIATLDWVVDPLLEQVCLQG